jgi:hypothetical protein
MAGNSTAGAIVSYRLVFWSIRTPWLPKTNAGSSAVFPNELDSGLFEGFPQFHNCPFLGSECTRLGFESLHAGKRHSGSISEVTLLPSKKGSRRADLLTS